MLNALDEETPDPFCWLSNGGNATLASYKSDTDKDNLVISKEHLAYIKTLPLYFETNDLLVTHSCIESKDTFLKTLDNDNYNDGFLWSRGIPALDLNKFSIFGQIS